MWWSLWITIGALLGGLSVGLGAFGAHALKNRLPVESLAVFETGARYQMYHAIVLLFVGILSIKVDSWLITSAGLCFTLGTILFSTSLYMLVLTDNKALGIITPIGGSILIIGWLLLSIAALRIFFS